MSTPFTQKSAFFYLVTHCASHARKIFGAQHRRMLIPAAPCKIRACSRSRAARKRPGGRSPRSIFPAIARGARRVRRVFQAPPRQRTRPTRMRLSHVLSLRYVIYKKYRHGAQAAPDARNVPRATHAMRCGGIAFPREQAAHVAAVARAAASRPDRLATGSNSANMGQPWLRPGGGCVT